MCPQVCACADELKRAKHRSASEREESNMPAIYTITIDGEFYCSVRAHHVDSVLEDLEMQGFDIEDVTWDDEAGTVELLTTSNEG